MGLFDQAYISQLGMVLLALIGMVIGEINILRMFKKKLDADTWRKVIHGKH